MIGTTRSSKLNTSSMRRVIRDSRVAGGGGEGGVVLRRYVIGGPQRKVCLDTSFKKIYFWTGYVRGREREGHCGNSPGWIWTWATVALVYMVRTLHQWATEVPSVFHLNHQSWHGYSQKTACHNLLNLGQSLLLMLYSTLYNSLFTHLRLASCLSDLVLYVP